MLLLCLDVRSVYANIGTVKVQFTSGVFVISADAVIMVIETYSHLIPLRAAATILTEPFDQLTDTTGRAKEHRCKGGQVNESSETVDQIHGEEGVLADQLAQVRWCQVVVHPGK